jgi:hypothetical protein
MPTVEELPLFALGRTGKGGNIGLPPLLNSEIQAEMEIHKGLN